MTKIKKNQFLSDLKRNYKQLRDSKASLIVANGEKYYRRQIEDMVEQLNQLSLSKQELINELIPGGIGNTAVVQAGFSVENMFEKDKELVIAERNIRITLDGICRRYQELFGPLKNVDDIKAVLPDVTIFEFEDDEVEVLPVVVHHMN